MVTKVGLTIIFFYLQLVLFNKHFFFREEMASASQQFNRKDTKFDASGQNRSLDIKIDDFDISFGDK